MEKTQTDSGRQADKIIHDFEAKKNKNSSLKGFGVIVIAIIIGIGVGFIFSRGKSVSTSMSSGSGSGAVIAKGSVYGSNDLSTFKDSATGTMEKGGIGDEGQFHLVRPGGDSQNVYLTSAIVDLSQFIGKKVKVNGQTQTAKQAGWLMDVGRVEVLQ